MNRAFGMIVAGLALALLAGCSSQRWLRYDAASLDPSKFTVEFENDHVRVLRARYAPDEISTMHQHPDSVVVFFDGGRADVAYPDGTTREIAWDARDVMWSPALTHRPHNRGGDVELVIVELKDRGPHLGHR